MELTPEEEEESEEHFFGCQECALDVRMGAALIEHGPALVDAPEAAEPQIVTAPSKPGWFGWLRPAMVIPVTAILLAIVGLQQFVVQPRLNDTIATLERPQVLASAYLSSGDTRGSNRPLIAARPGAPFVLFIDVPGSGHSSSYLAELYSPTGAKEWSLPITPEAVETAHGTLPIRISLTHNQPGVYVLVLRDGGTNGSSGSEIGRYPFEVQFK